MTTDPMTGADSSAGDGAQNTVVKFRVSKTPQGYRVREYDGDGLADGVFALGVTRYFYGDQAEKKAHDYAERKAEKRENATVVSPRERLA